MSIGLVAATIYTAVSWPPSLTFFTTTFKRLDPFHSLDKPTNSSNSLVARTHMHAHSHTVTKVI